MDPRRFDQTEDGRNCKMQTAGANEMPSEQRPNIVIPHYQEHCTCFSCKWVRKTKRPFILSRMELNGVPYPVVNPTHHRVPQDERRRLLTPVAKEKFQIMYIYAMEIAKGKWGWVVALPLPLLPFLLTEDKYSGISSISRHPQHGWYGLKYRVKGAEQAEQVEIGHTMAPPLYNPLYQYYGYDPQSSPYRLHGPSHRNKTVDNRAPQPSDDDTHSSCRSSTGSNTRASTSTQETSTLPSPESKINGPLEKEAAPPVVDNVTPALRELVKVSAEAQATSSQSPTHQSSSGNEQWQENPEWVVIDPRRANAPEPTRHSDHKCQNPSQNGKYNRATDWWNTTIFVGGLSNDMTREELHYWFEGFGELLHVRKKVGQTYGFVQYPGRKEAEMAMSQVSRFQKQSSPNPFKERIRAVVPSPSNTFHSAFFLGRL